MKFIAGFVVALIAVTCAALVIMYTGSYNVAANVRDNPVVDWYLSNTMIHSVVNRAPSPCKRRHGSLISKHVRDLRFTIRLACIVKVPRGEIQTI